MTDNMLTDAALDGDPEAFRNLLEKGMSMQYIEKVVVLLCALGHLKCIQFLVSEGLGRECFLSFNAWALRRAAEKGHVEILEFLFEEFGLDERSANLEHILSYAKEQARSVEFLVSKIESSKKVCCF